MSKIEVRLLDATRCAAVHPASGARLTTDIGRAYGGGGSSFSSTDLVAVALATCIGSSLAPIALREGIPLDSIRITAGKELGTNPKRIARLTVAIDLPPGLSEAQRSKLGNAARTCTVHRTLHDCIEMAVELRSAADGSRATEAMP